MEYELLLYVLALFSRCDTKKQYTYRDPAEEPKNTFDSIKVPRLRVDLAKLFLVKFTTVYIYLVWLHLFIVFCRNP
jgi:hypothetical protein